MCKRGVGELRSADNPLPAFSSRGIQAPAGAPPPTTAAAGGKKYLYITSFCYYTHTYMPTEGTLPEQKGAVWWWVVVLLIVIGPAVRDQVQGLLLPELRLPQPVGRRSRRRRPQLAKRLHPWTVQAASPATTLMPCSTSSSSRALAQPLPGLLALIPPAALTLLVRLHTPPPPLAPRTQCVIILCTPHLHHRD